MAAHSPFDTCPQDRRWNLWGNRGTDSSDGRAAYLQRLLKLPELEGEGLLDAIPALLLCRVRCSELRRPRVLSLRLFLVPHRLCRLLRGVPCVSRLKRRLMLAYRRGQLRADLRQLFRRCVEGLERSGAYRCEQRNPARYIVCKRFVLTWAEAALSAAL